MFKKLILAAGLLAAGTMLITGTRIGAYGRAMVGWAKNKVVSQVPLEADIAAAKQLLTDMDGKIENAVRTVARERVEVRKLDEQFARRDAELKQKKEQIVSMKTKLQTNLAAYNPTEQELEKARLSALFTTYETTEQQQKSEYKLLESRRLGLVSSELKVEKLKSAQRELRGKIESLDARRKLMEAEKVAAIVEVDDSEIASLKNLVSDIEKKIDVEAETEKELESLKSGKPVPEATPSSKDVMEKIDQKFGNGKPSTTGARI